MGGLKINERKNYRKKKTTTNSKISTKFTLMINDEVLTLKEFKELYEFDVIWTQLLEESDLNVEELFKAYNKILLDGVENEYFESMYKIRDEMAISIGRNIYICHIVDLSIAGERLLPWDYIDSKNFIAHTWWENDNDVLKDLASLSVVDFLIKYNAY